MKQRTSLVLTLVLVLALCLLLVACGETPPPEESLWDSATYTADATVGEGARTVTLRVEAGERSVTLTVKTDEDTLGEALYALGLINDPSFFDTVCGMRADFDATGAYWAFYIGGDYATLGVADAGITGGESFALVYTVYTAP